MSELRELYQQVILDHNRNPHNFGPLETTQLLKGRTDDEARSQFDSFHEMVMSDTDTPVDLETAGKLAVFAGVREFPMRVKCATLAWHTMKSAIEGAAEVPVTTE